MSVSESRSLVIARAAQSLGTVEVRALARPRPDIRRSVMPDPHGHLRLVIAEDEPLLRHGMVRLLSEQGFQGAAEAATAEELLRALCGGLLRLR